MNTNHRRLFLKKMATTGAVAAAVSTGLISPRLVMAAYPKNSFEAKTAEEVMSTLLGKSESAKSTDIVIKAPEIAENGSVVPISVSCNLPNVDSITVLVDKNEQPLACSFSLGKTTEANVSTRVKMAKTSNLTAIVKSDGKLFSASKEVKVTIGGCGG